MKRVIVFFVCTICSLCIYAKNPFMTIKSGSLDIFNDSICVNVEINDYNPIIDGENQYAEDYYTAQGQNKYFAFCDDLKRAHESFISYYNIEKGKLKSIVGKSNEYPYTLQIDVTLMNVGNAGASLIGLSHKSGGALINGTMTLIDNSTKLILCEIEFQGIKGMRAPVFSGRAISVYRYLADAFLETIKE